MKKRILIFDDDTELLSILEYILNTENWETVCHTNCNDLIKKVKAGKPHVILMDNRIPDKGGVESTQILKRDPELQTIPVIYFSANNDIAALAKKAGADTYVAKPFDLTELEKTIKGFLEA